MAKAFGTSLISWPSGWLALGTGGGGAAEEAGRREPRANCEGRQKNREEKTERFKVKPGKMKNSITGERERKKVGECVRTKEKRNGGHCGKRWEADLRVGVRGWG